MIKGCAVTRNVFSYSTYLKTDPRFWLQVIFDNFAKILKLCVENNQQEIADALLDTRVIWEQCLHADHEVCALLLHAQMCGGGIDPVAPTIKWLRAIRAWPA